jgi:hypothetical protein
MIMTYWDNLRALCGKQLAHDMSDVIPRTETAVPALWPTCLLRFTRSLRATPFAPSLSLASSVHALLVSCF